MDRPALALVQAARQVTGALPWRRLALWPALAALAALAGLQLSGLDLALNDLFFDAASGRFPAAHGFWAHTVVHAGGKRLVYLIALGWLLVLGVGLLPRLGARWAPWRRASLYVLLVLAAVPGLVGVLQRASDTPCPVYTERYGGPWPYVPLYAPTPYDLPGVGCFPGAHSAAAFALFGLYFVFRRARPVLARRLLWGVGALGALYALGQTARGAHSLSHDLVSAALAWAVALLAYAVLFRGRLHPEDLPHAAGTLPR